MPAYVSVSYDIVDRAGFEAYVPAVMPLLEKHSAEVLVGSFDAKVLEGARKASGVVESIQEALVRPSLWAARQAVREPGR